VLLVSLIITTRDRADSLKATLAAVEKLTIPPDWAVEMVVVDNGSSDNTSEVAANGSVGGHRTRVVLEPVPGVARARNRGAAESAGEVLLFLDDDVHPPPVWAIRLAAPIVEGLAAATVSEFRLACDRPWLTERDRAALISESSIDPATPFLAAGGMAISREAFVEAAGFEEELGPGALGAGGEDLLLTYKLQASGRSLMFVDDLNVLHYPDPAKLERAALKAREVAAAKSEAWLAYHWFGRSDPYAVSKSRVLTLASRLTRGDARTRMAVRAAWHRQMAIEQRRSRKFNEPFSSAAS
jgi:glycosyltransferase involved in cell wall biosynthesis